MSEYANQSGEYEEWRVQAESSEGRDMPPFDFVWSPRLSPQLLEGKSAEQCARDFVTRNEFSGSMRKFRISRRTVTVGPWEEK